MNTSLSQVTNTEELKWTNSPTAKQQISRHPVTIVNLTTNTYTLQFREFKVGVELINCCQLKRAAGAAGRAAGMAEAAEAVRRVFRPFRCCQL